MYSRVQRILWLFLLWIGWVAADTLQFPLYHQLLHSNSAREVTPRGTIKYDTTSQSAVYEKQSDVIDPTAGEGIYRITVYDKIKKDFGPWGFTKLVFAIIPLADSRV